MTLQPTSRLGNWFLSRLEQLQCSGTCVLTIEQLCGSVQSFGSSIIWKPLQVVAVDRIKMILFL